ncbi:hypothetical protein HU200_030282 [Digitaria exilis]|uniref:Uncharacterized protein n=1 Tax=Digitaria exilis TaxID=1010633 RepID=A0A835BRW2_9POAL|nr:hypothetical protein HU200_030282 [Digitaria exilis]CAB3463102.1 unnamed protein product [Digitaria exilis]
MAAAGDRRRGVAHTLQVLIAFVCLLSPASGLRIPHGDLPDMHRHFRRDQVWYPPGVEVVIVDLGNTNSCISGFVPGKTAVDMFQFCIPSWVTFTDDGVALVGEAAKDHAGAGTDATTVFGIKRLLGLGRHRMYEEDIVQEAIERAPYKMGTRHSDTPIVQLVKGTGINGAVKELGFTDVASMVVAQLKNKAEEYLGRPVEYAVITVPQHFGGASRQAAEYAARFAGLEVVDAVSEPIAIAVAYGLRTRLREGGNALVVHVGGGTADVSVVTLMVGSLGVLAYWDEPFLGGDDFDQRIVEHFVELVKVKHGKDVREDRIALAKLRTACERAKKALSSQDRVQVTVESLFDGIDFSEPLSRSKFEELNDETFGRVVALIRRVMLQAEEKRIIMRLIQEKRGVKLDARRKRTDGKISEIILVGGSTMIPKLQRLVKDYFDGMEPNMRLKQDEAVALGALVHAYSSV